MVTFVTKTFSHFHVEDERYRVAGIPLSQPISDLHQLKDVVFTDDGRVKKESYRKSRNSASFFFDSPQPPKNEEPKKSRTVFSLSESQEVFQQGIAEDIFTCLWYGHFTAYAREFSDPESDHRNRRHVLFGWRFDPLLDVLLENFGAATRSPSLQAPTDDPLTSSAKWRRFFNS